LMAALAVGGEYSAVTAAMGEFIPRKNRGRTDSLILAGFPIGALLSAVVSYFLLNNLPPAIAWRVGFGLGALMAVVFVWIRKVVPESPRWLLQHGRLAEAEAVVDKIAATAKGALSAQGQRRYEPTPFTPSEPAFFRNIAQLFNKYGAETCLASATNFSQAVVVYGTLSLMALVILPFMKVPAASMPLYYALGNGAALLGGLFAAFCVEAWGRRASLFTSYTFTVCAIVGLYLAQQLPHMVLGYCLIQFGVTWAYITAYVVSAEILPTRVRASGLGISVAVGRLGAMVTPVLLTNAFMVTGNPSGALLVLLVLAAPGPVAALLWWLRGRETRGISLEQGSIDPLVGQLLHPQPAVVAAE
jgi:MFS family permease